jgi:hypothetical protein
VLRLLDVTATRAAIQRAPNRTGTKHLNALLSMPSPGPTRSALEDEFLELCRVGSLPTPRMNATVATPTRLLEVDALWPTERVIVELDGAAVHRTAKAFHEDRRRDAALAAEGYIVIRLTWQRVTQEAEAVIAELHRILASRSGTFAAR